MPTLKDAVKLILEVTPEARGNDGFLSIKYRDSFYEGSDRDFIYDNIAISIVKTRQNLQRKFIHLRPSEQIQEKRQKCCNKFRQEYRKSRSQELPEDLSDMFVPIESLEKKRWISFIKNIIKSF